MWFLLLWGIGFGGIPRVLMVGTVFGTLEVQSDGPASSSPLLFLSLFPAIAVAVVWFGMRRWLRSGFTFTDEGITGAHDDEEGLVAWDRVARIRWRFAGPTSDVRINGRPLPSGPALFAVLDDGSELRLMQACADSPADQRRMVRQLDRAVASGVVPVPVERDVDRVVAEADRHSLGWDEDGRTGERTASVRTWSSSGRGEAVPQAGPDDAPGVAWDEGDRDEGDRDEGDRDEGDPHEGDRDGGDTDDEPPPVWPTG